jgi:site-specific DNA recombinase
MRRGQVTGPIDVYARVSRLKDKDQTTTASQVAVCRAELGERGLPVGKVHIDDGKSAWDPKVVRKDWEALMARLESGEAGGVIVYDLERFARQLRDGERLVALAERGLVILDSEGSYDLRKPGDKKNFRNAIVAAEYYSDLLRVKVRRGKAAKAHSGEVDERRSFGFNSDGVTVDGREAALIRDWAARLLAGETQQDLIRELNDTGVPSVRGARWGYTTFRQIMLRPRNIGLIVHNGEVVPGRKLPGEPILDQLTYDRIVALYAARKPGRQPSGRYTLSGLAECHCGGPLSGRPVSGSTRRQYYCKRCLHTFVDTRRLDDWAGDFAVRTLSDQEEAEAIEREDREREQQRQALVTEAASIEATLTEIGARLGTGAISLQRHDAICAPLEQRQAGIRAELQELAQATPEPIPQGTRTLQQFDPRGYAMMDWLEQWDSGSPAERRALVLRALHGRKLVIGPGQDARFDPDRVQVVAWQ